MTEEATGTGGGFPPQVTTTQAPPPVDESAKMAVADGWYRFFKTRKAHYFKDNRSLCKEYTGMQKVMVRIELSEIHKHPKCMACLRVAATMVDQLSIVPSIIPVREGEEVVTRQGKNISDTVVVVRAPPEPKVPLKHKLRNFLMKVLS